MPAHDPRASLEFLRLPDSNLLDALILGVVEGVTEFIPVSSTGHLILARDFLGYPVERFDVLVFIIQLAAILAICLLYAGRLTRVLLGLSTKPEARRFVLAVTIAFVPSVVLGLLLNDLMKRYLFSTWVVAVALIVGGVAILVIERLAHRPRYHDTAEVPPATALGIGLWQTVSMIPGVSRAGATIMGGLLLGLDRKAAAEFSFFLAIPTMIGASALDLYKGWGRIDGSLGLEIAVASLAAFVTAIVVVRAFVSFLGRHTFVPFGWYRIGAGFVMLALLAAGAA
jgi:undecaprenyl-diphosphatase